MTVPKTRNLTKKQTALVDTLVAKGCTLREAAAEAGYAEGESGRVTASRTIRLPHVQQYMQQQVQQVLGLSATTAAKRLLDLTSGARSEYVQLEAAKDILDRAGYKPVERRQVQTVGELRVSIDLG